jgi:RimJ/RimL family protein N-acetyltransferase
MRDGGWRRGSEPTTCAAPRSLRCWVVAHSRNYTQLYLEAGPVAAFTPARALYERHGFVYCGPFADYVEDPYSVFMVKAL